MVSDYKTLVLGASLKPQRYAYQAVLQLTRNEIAWVNKYHKKVRNTLMPSMNSREKDWLVNQTAPL